MVQVVLLCYYTAMETLRARMAIKKPFIGARPNYGKGHGPINHISLLNINKKFK